MKKYLAGFLIGALLTMTTSAFADDISNLVGKKVQAESAVQVGGKTIETVVVEGKNYAPVRDIGEAAGYTVTVDNKKVILTKKNNSEAIVTSEQQLIKNIESQKKAIIYANEELNKYIAEVDRIKALQAEGPKPYDKFDYEKGIKDAENTVTRQRELIKTQETRLADLERQLAELQK
jgi:hypothetical protein